jgi:hypothetical protein
LCYVPDPAQRKGCGAGITKVGKVIAIRVLKCHIVENNRVAQDRGKYATCKKVGRIARYCAIVQAAIGCATAGSPSGILSQDAIIEDAAKHAATRRAGKIANDGAVV